MDRKGIMENYNFSVVSVADLRTFSARFVQHRNDNPKIFFNLCFKEHGKKIYGIGYFDQFGVLRVTPFDSKVIKFLYSIGYEKVPPIKLDPTPANAQATENFLKLRSLYKERLSKMIFCASDSF